MSDFSIFEAANIWFLNYCITNSPYFGENYILTLQFRNTWDCSTTQPKCHKNKLPIQTEMHLWQDSTTGARGYKDASRSQEPELRVI